MKLPDFSSDLPSQLAEFDVWITPSLGEIRDTDRFQAELNSVAGVFDALADATDEFSDIEHCSADAIAASFAEQIQGMKADAALEMLQSLASVLYLVTGKSDNNSKCQLPLHLRDNARWDSFPTARTRGSRTTVGTGPIPRELKAKKYMKVVSMLQSREDLQETMLREFTSFLIGDEQYARQFWSIGRSYCMLREIGRESDLLTPLVVFQVRGSVSASGGHGPEDMLRERLTEWGLISGVDFNTTDVVIGSGSNGRRAKTRAYDFVLPYNTVDWQRKLFVQCQFYAGDSGSVSHKNVDQTSTSRESVLGTEPDARFIEYVDGAGYFSSLNGDLKNILSMENTGSFFQIRTAPIRLRRELQSIGFLTPLEIEHAILRTDASQTAVGTLLEDEGYSRTEIERQMQASLQKNFISLSNDRLQVATDRRELVRRYLLLDIAAIHGQSAASSGNLKGCILVPGYGPFHGMKVDELISTTVDEAQSVRDAWSSPELPSQDIRWLCEQGYCISS